MQPFKTRRLVALAAIIAISACSSELGTPSKSPLSPPVPYTAKPTVVDLGNGKRHYIGARLNPDIVVHRVDTVHVETRADGKCRYAIKYNEIPRGQAAVVQEMDDSSCMAVVYYVTIPDRGLAQTSRQSVSSSRP